MVTEERPMYLPPHFREDRLDVQHAMMRAHPFGALVTVGKDGLQASHIPFVLDATASPLGTLRGHLSRANDQWKLLDPDQDALVMFQGPQAYVTPAWYPLKQETGKVVPTWNYVIVQAYGRPRIVQDGSWLAKNVADLTGQHERNRPQPWAVSDAPDDFIAGLLKGIVGVEIEITRIEGKWKASQNRPDADRAGVVGGLAREPEEQARVMSQIVAERGAVVPR
jgi:transcriptional regulator